MNLIAKVVISSAATLSVTGCNHIGPIHAYAITSKSMEPTINEGDKVLVDESYYSNHPMEDGALVVFRHNEYILIKRVIALAGETVESREGVLVRNGHTLNEPYARHTGDPSPAMQTFPARVVPPGELFVTGDNRDFSLDSRLPEFGIVHPTDVLGTPTLVTSNHGFTSRRLQ